MGTAGVAAVEKRVNRPRRSDREMTTTVITITIITTTREAVAAITRTRGACPMAGREVVCVRRGRGRDSPRGAILPMETGYEAFLVGVGRWDRTGLLQERVLFRLCVRHRYI